jgi:pimeloyl-ACP methyl ester carboxylesterase
MNIDLLEPVRLGESTQWIRIRAANTSNPLLLLVQMGPGLPMINEAQTFGRLLSLEDDFTVIYWDQRGCGRSLRSPDATRDLSLQAMVSDTEPHLEEPGRFRELLAQVRLGLPASAPLPPAQP